MNKMQIIDLKDCKVYEEYCKENNIKILEKETRADYKVVYILEGVK